MVGRATEWYHRTLEGTAAAPVFNDVFFPQFSAGAGTVALGTSAVGFVARPVGGFVAGHYRDRIGRKASLVVRLLAMGIATTLVGLRRTAAGVGLWVPMLLIALRLVQGFAVGANWGTRAVAFDAGYVTWKALMISRVGRSQARYPSKALAFPQRHRESDPPGGLVNAECGVDDITTGFDASARDLVTRVAITVTSPPWSMRVTNSYLHAAAH